MIHGLKLNEIMGAPKKTCLRSLKTFNTGWPNFFLSEKKNSKGLLKSKLIHFIIFFLVMGKDMKCQNSLFSRVLQTFLRKKIFWAPVISF